jgi:hypothetical protein
MSETAAMFADPMWTFVGLLFGESILSTSLFVASRNPCNEPTAHCHVRCPPFVKSSSKPQSSPLKPLNAWSSTQSWPTTLGTRTRFT